MKETFSSDTPTISTSAYASGDVIGASYLTFQNAVGENGSMGTALTAKLFDFDGQDAEIDLLLFKAPPTSTLTDNAALALNEADTLNLLGAVEFRYYTSLGTPSFSQVEKVGLGLTSVRGTIYGILVSRDSGTPTYTDTDHVTVEVVTV